MRNWAALSGIAAVALGMVGGALFGGQPISGGDAAVTAWYAERGHRVRVEAAYFVVVAACLCLCLFVATVRAALGPKGRLTTLATIGGAATAILSALAATFGFMAAGQITKWVGSAAFDPHVARTTTFLGEVLLETALAFSSLFVGAVSLAALRSGVLSRWLAWAGLASAVLLLVGFPLLAPVFLLLGWIAVVSIVLARDQRGAARAGPA